MPCAGRSASVPTSRSTGRSVLDIAVRENDDGLAVILHNLTNPMMMKGPIREIYPGRAAAGLGRVLDGQGARHRPPARRRPRGQGHASTTAASIVEVPGIDTLEVVHLTWA